nr:transposase [Actinomadura mexicana]
MPPSWEDRACRESRRPRAVHDPGKVVAAQAVMLALGGDCLSDIAVLRAEPELFGAVPSDPTVSRLVTTLAHGSGRHDRARALRQAARGPDVAAHLRPPSHDGVHRPRPRGTGEAAALVLRPGNAGSNTAADHITAGRLTLNQIPTECVDQKQQRLFSCFVNDGAAFGSRMSDGIRQRSSRRVGQRGATWRRPPAGGLGRS